MTCALVLTAAGNSTRMGGPVKKEYLTVATADTGRISVLSAALHAFISTGFFFPVIITVPSGGEAEARSVLAEDGRIASLLATQGIEPHFAEGGKSRQESVRSGLELTARIARDASMPEPDFVMIHDGARPWVSADIIRGVLAETQKTGAAVPGIPSTDTQKEIDASGKILRHLERARIVSVQTPQGFRFSGIREAHEKAAGDGTEYTDDTEIWGRYNGDVAVCPGDRANKKITYQGDIA
jgi:2-C-methyl-D-erythritol 4-phosphate cytidylyltransferase